MNTYRVVIDTVSEWYEYEVDADSEVYAEILAKNLAEGDGWSGRGLPRITVTQL